MTYRCVAFVIDGMGYELRFQTWGTKNACLLSVLRWYERIAHERCQTYGKFLMVEVKLFGDGEDGPPTEKLVSEYRFNNNGRYYSRSVRNFTLPLVMGIRKLKYIAGLEG